MKAIIFDMDGVMIDSEYAYTAAIKAEVESLGHAISEDYIYGFVGTTLLAQRMSILGNRL